MAETPIRELFDQAHALPAAQRAGFLAQHCADPVQRTLLERMLAAADAPADGPVLPRDPLRWAEDIGEAPAGAARDVGRQVGPFVIEAVLGEGGSARVFRAVREVEGVTQVVALKVLRHGLASGSARAQFDRERRALARVVHPAIASFIDAGISADGEAWIALEFIDGVSLVEHARVNALGSRERVRLMVDVAHAVGAAHRSLVVHRDLKPANILVDRQGRIKLLDFGIAKLIEAPSSDDGTTQTQTQTQFRAFTPAYAAPEQREGGPITTATDVYSLGVVLTELLTGLRRSGSASATPAVFELAAGDAAPPAVAARPLPRPWRADLDNILGKACAAEPELRYESAGAFADDLQRLLAGEPVSAHPPSGVYRLRKFVGRHRGAVALGVVVSLGIVAALGLALWQADVARREAARAREITGFLVDLFRAAEDRLPRNQRPTPTDLVDAARRQLAGSSNLDADTRAEIEATLAEVSRLGADDAAAEALFTAAAARLGPSESTTPLALRIRIGQAQVRLHQARYADALRAVEAVLPLLAAAQPELRLEALEVRLAAQLALGEPAAAIETARTRLAIARASWPAGDARIVRAEAVVGGALAAAENYRDAVDVLAAPLAQWQALGLPPDRDYMDAATAQASALHGLGELADAKARWLALLQLQRSIYREPHDRIANTLRSYASVLATAGEVDAAIQAHRESIAMLQSVFGADHDELVGAHAALGVTLASVRRFADAEAEYLRALSICASHHPAGVACAQAHNNLGMTYYRQQQYAPARAQMQQALARYREVYAGPHLNIAITLGTLANVAFGEGDALQAVALARESMAMIETVGMARSPVAATTHNSLAAALWLAGQNAEALVEIDLAIELFDQVRPAVLGRRTMMRVQRAQILRDLGRTDDARATAEAAIALGAPGAELAARTRYLLRELSGRADLYPGLD